MKKAITFVALASVAMTAEFNDDELNVFKKIGNGLKNAGKFVIQHPKIITTAAKILLLEDEELFKLSELHHIENDVHKVKDWIHRHPELVEKVHTELKRFAHKHHIEAEDEELFNKDLFKKIAEDVKKGYKYAQEHPEIVQDGVDIVKDIKNKDTRKLIHDGIRTLQDLGFEDEELELLSDEELFKIGKAVKNVAHGIKKGTTLIKDGVNIYGDVQTGNYGKLVKDGFKTYKDIKADEEDDELFNLKKTVQKIGKGIKKGADFVGAHPALIKDGANIVKDIKNKDIKGLIKDGVKTYKDARADDDELFNKDLFKKITEDLKKGYKYAQEHPEVVQDGVDIVKDIKNKDTRKLIHDGIRTLQDLGFEDEEVELLSDEELFKIGKAVKNVAHGIKKGTTLVKDGVKIYTDVQTGNYGKLVKDGFKTYKDIKADEEEDDELFNLKKTIQKIGKGVKKGIDFVQAHPAVIGDGKNIIKDIKNKDIKGLIKDGVKTYKDIHADDEELFAFEDEELFNLKKTIQKIGKGVKKGIDFVQAHPAVIGDGKNIIKDIKNHDIKQLIKDGVKTYKDIHADDEELFAFEDDELFNLKKTVSKIGHGIKKGADFVGSHPALIKDGAHIIKDIKNKDVKGLIKDGFKTYKDIHADDEELFAFEDEELFSLKKVAHSVGNGIKKGASFIGSHPALIKDGVNIVKDVKNKNVVGLVKDGFKTYKDLGFEDQEFFQTHAFKDLGFEDQTDNNLFNLGELIKDGKKIHHDIKTHDVVGLIKDGVKVVKDVKDKKFLF